MLMFLTMMVVSLPVLLFACLAAAGADRREEKPTETQPEPRPTVPARFFAEGDNRLAGSNGYPVEVLLSQIERHVRLEQAAAESFLAGPSTEALHSRTTSSVLN